MIEFHEILNRNGMFSPAAYRLTSFANPVIADTNTIIALYQSCNYELIPTFVYRLRKRQKNRFLILEQRLLSGERYVSDEYLQVVDKYVDAVIQDLAERGITVPIDFDDLEISGDSEQP